jgi:hypothetical protein
MAGGTGRRGGGRHAQPAQLLEAMPLQAAKAREAKHKEQEVVEAEH